MSEGFNHILEANSEGYQKILQKCWEEIDEHEQKLYKKALPGAKQDSEKQQETEHDDLSKYEPQKIETKSPPAFGMLVFYPVKIDKTIYPQPQVIADARNPQFESLMKAPKKAKRYLYSYDAGSDTWDVVELNP